MNFPEKCPTCGCKRCVNITTEVEYQGAEYKEGAYMSVKKDKPQRRHIEAYSYCPACGHREIYRCWEPLK